MLSKREKGHVVHRRPFAPFVGAGIGAAHSRIGETIMKFPTTTIVPEGSRTEMAWMATAGVA